MARGKLILICQSGGEFVKNDDGTLSYYGGEANALDISLDTPFENLKWKLAEMLNLDCKDLSIKYFLPGNKHTLITLSNDKDLKRMYDFHGNSITADIFITGRPGFDGGRREMRDRICGVKAAEAVLPIAALPSSSGRASLPVPAPGGSVSNAAPGNQVLSPSHFLSPDAVEESPGIIDMTSTPADTVKKRRRTASLKTSSRNILSEVNGDDAGKKRTTSRKKGIPKRAADTEWHVGNIDLNNSSANNGDISADKAKKKSSSRRKKIMKRNTARTADNALQEGENGRKLSSMQDNYEDIPAEQLLELWKDCITGVDQEFNNVAEFRDALQRYAVANRFMYRLKKNDTNRASVRCAAGGCSWKIYAAWDVSEEKFIIKTMNKSHTCGEESWKSAHPKKNWLVSVIKDRLKRSPYQKPKEIANGIRQDFGIDVNYSQVWRGIEDAREQLEEGSYKGSYNRLPWFCEKMMEKNPGSCVKLVTGSDKRFKQLFVSFCASICGFQAGCRPLLFLDSAPLRSKYHETLLTATALDGDDGHFPVAFAVVNEDNDDNWLEFLRQLKSAVSNLRTLTFVSDREKGLKKLVRQVFEDSPHGYSIQDLLACFMRDLKGPFRGDGKASLPVNFMAAAKSVRLDVFKMFTQQIKQVSSSAYDWLMEIEPECWTNAVFEGERYNHIDIDISKLYTNWIDEMREFPITRKVEFLVSKVMEVMRIRQAESAKCSTHLTPSKEALLKQEMIKACNMKVLFSSETLFEVHDDAINVVDIDKEECSCLGWKPTGLPCCHAIAVFNCTGRNAYNYCSRYFTANSYQLAYSESINHYCLRYFTTNSHQLAYSESNNPVAESLIPPAGTGKGNAKDAGVLPPCPSRFLSPDKKKEIRARAILKRKTVTCTKCKQKGHNKVTCSATS